LSSSRARSDRDGGQAGLMADDPGVMGNLPRSRPGRRSEKRASGAGGKASTSKAGGGKSRSGGGGGPRQTQARSSSAKPKSERPRSSQPSAPAADGSQHGDPISDAIRLATRLAG